jgi:dihydrofolate reductase
MACRAEVTEIEQPFEGDAYAPSLGPGWQELARQSAVAQNGLRYSFVSLGRS